MGCDSDWDESEEEEFECNEEPEEGNGEGAWHSSSRTELGR